MKRNFKNIFISLVLALALFFAPNLPMLKGLSSFVHSANAEYKSKTTNTYDFRESNIWTTNYPSSSELTSAFTDSSANLNMYDYQGTKPATNYKGGDINLSEGQSRPNPEDEDYVDQYAMTLQAKNAPTRVWVNKTDDDGNTVYMQDGDGNPLLEPELYTDKAGDADYVLFSNAGNIYRPSRDADNANKYVKKLKDANGNDKVDGAGHVLYEPKVYTSNGNDTKAYVSGENGEYYKKIIEVEEVDSYYAFRTRSNYDIDLTRDNWYVVSLWVWTSENTTTTIIITGTDYEAKIEHLDTKGKWINVHFFLESSAAADNAVNIFVYYGDKEKLYYSAEPDYTTDSVTGSIFVDDITVKQISEAEYKNHTIDGEKIEDIENTITYSPRFDYNLNDPDGQYFINGDFDKDLNIYPLMLDQDGYAGELKFDDKSGEYINDLEAFKYQYQFYISRYRNDTGTDLNSEDIIKRYYDYYTKGKFTYEIVNETEEFATERDKKDENGDPVLGEDNQPEKEKVPGPSTFKENNRVLKLHNETNRSLGLLSRPIVISQFGYYRLSLYLKATDEDAASYTIKLLSSVLTGQSGAEGTRLVKSQSDSTLKIYTTESDMTNNWTEVTFYIQGNCYMDMPLQLAILVGKESTIYVDHIRLEGITSSQYSSATGAQQFDLSSSSTSINSNITNGYFTSIKKSKVNPADEEVPYVPSDWTTLSDNSKDVVSGVISTRDDFYSSVKEKIGNPDNPITSITVNEKPIELPKTNVLVIYGNKGEDNTKYDKFGYKSPAFSLSSNSFYKITFQILLSSTAGSSKFTGKVFANLLNSDGDHIAEFEEELTDDIQLEGWLTYTIAVRTGTSSRTYNLEIGAKDFNGTMFVQRVGRTAFEEKTDPNDDEKKISAEDQFNEFVGTYSSHQDQIDNRVRLVSYDTDSFLMHSLNVNEKGYYDSFSHSLREAADDEKPIVQGEMGIIDDKTGFPLVEGFDKSFYATNDSFAKSDLVMFIHNGQAYDTVVNPNANITLSSSSYYEISVYVKTKGIAEGNGLTIRMNQISATFSNINTEQTNYGDTTSTNGYKKFTVIVKTGTSSISGLRISYELGSSSAATTGTVFLTSLSVNKLADKDAYDELVNAVDKNDVSTILKDFTSSTPSSTIDDDADNLTMATFFLVFSSILLVAALVFAIVAVYFKKAPKNAKVTGKNNGNTPDAAPKDGFV